VTGCTSSKVDVNTSLRELHERIAYSSPLVLGDTVYVGIHDTGDSPIQQGRVVAVDLNTGHLLTGFQFLGAGNAPGDGNLGGGVWSALATDGTAVYFTTGNSHWPWCVYPYFGNNCPPNDRPPNKEPTPNYGLSMVRVDKDTGVVGWYYQPVPFALDGDPDWAAGATVMSTSCGELIASVQKDGWSYAIDANRGPSCPLTGNSWQFPPTTGGCQFTDTSQVHGDDDYRRPGAAWNDVFIVRTGGEANTDRGYRGYSELHALNACATSEQDRVRWIAEIPNTMGQNGHTSYSTPTVTGGIVFIGTNQNKIDNKGHLVVLADPSVAPASQQVCSNVDVPLAACTAPYAHVWSLQPLADVPMPDGGSLASMRNEPVLAEGRVFVATNPTPNFPNAGYVYILAPSGPGITDVIPSTGSENGGDNVTIIGFGFSNNMTLMFGAVSVSGFACSSDGTWCDLTSPPGTGQVDITSTVNGVTSAKNPHDVFTYEALPFGSMSPTSGLESGGTVVTVAGGNFSTTPGATSFAFSFPGTGSQTAAATNVACANTNLCTFTSPPWDPQMIGQLAPVSATVNGLTGRIGEFTYTAPLPPPGSLLDVEINPSPVWYGQSATCSVFIEAPQTPQAVAIALSSSRPSLAPVPPSVTIPAGATEASFAINTSLPPPPLPRFESVDISATAGGTTRHGSLIVGAPPGKDGGGGGPGPKQ
jgi:hypothetical protein